MKTEQGLRGMKAGLMLVLSLILLSGLVGATISYAAGTNLITLDDSVGAGDSWGTCYDEDDIVANCGAVATKQGTNAYDISARLYFADGVYFCSKNSFVELKPNPTNPSYTILAAAGSHIRIGNYNSGDGYSYNGAFWRIYTQANSGSQTNRFNGELLVYGSNIWTDATDYPKGLHFVKGAKIRLYNSVHRHPSYFWAVDTDIQNVKWDGTGGSYDMLVASGPNFNWAGLTTSACQKGIFFSSTTTSSVDVYDFKPLNAGTDVYVSTGINSAHLIRIINSPLAITCSNPGAGKQGVQFCYAFNVKVTNDAGNPIVGATVSLKDVDGNDAFTPENTVAGGVLASDKIVKWYWFRNAADGGNKDYNDHTLKVVSGAEETEYKIKIDHQIKEDIILIPQSTASYDNIMGAIEATNALSLSPVVGAFYFQEDEVEGYVLTRNRSGDLVSASVNVNVTYPNGSQLWAGAAAEEASGRYKYNLTVPSDAPLGAYGVRVDANKSGSDAHEVGAFLVLSGGDSYPFLVIKSGVGFLLLLFLGRILYCKRKNHAS